MKLKKILTSFELEQISKERKVEFRNQGQISRYRAIIDNRVEYYQRLNGDYIMR